MFKVISATVIQWLIKGYKWYTEMCRSLVLCQDLTGSQDIQHELKVGFCEMQWSQCFSEVLMRA